MSEFVSSPCQAIKEGEQLNIKIPESSVQVGIGCVVFFKEDGVYKVEVSDNQKFVIVTKLDKKNEEREK